MKLLACLCCFLTSILPLLGSEVDSFFTKNPEQKSRYRYLVQTTVDLEIDRANEKQAELFVLLNDIRGKMAKSQELKTIISRKAEDLRARHQEVIGAWEAFRKEMSPLDVLCIYYIIDGSYSENGYLILRDGKILKTMKESEGTYMLPSGTEPIKSR